MHKTSMAAEVVLQEKKILGKDYKSTLKIKVTYFSLEDIVSKNN